MGNCVKTCLTQPDQGQLSYKCFNNRHQFIPLEKNHCTLFQIIRKDVVRCTEIPQPVKLVFISKRNTLAELRHYLYTLDGEVDSNTVISFRTSFNGASTNVFVKNDEYRPISELMEPSQTTIVYEVYYVD